MDDKLTWGDAENYFLSWHSDVPRLAPERLALVKEDLNKGNDSLVKQYMILRTSKLVKSIEMWEAFSLDEAAEHIDRIGEKLSTCHPNTGKNFAMLLTDKLAELRSHSAGEEKHPETRKSDDFRGKSRYNRDEGGWSRN